MSEPDDPGPWRRVAVRFLEGGRAQQTPRAIQWQGAWLEVGLLGEELVSLGDPPGLERRFRLADADGGLWELRGAEGSWRAKCLTAVAGKC